MDVKRGLRNSILVTLMYESEIFKIIKQDAVNKSMCSKACRVTSWKVRAIREYERCESGEMSENKDTS